MKSKEDLFQDHFSITFQNQGLLKRALTHRSCRDEENGNNERLEFLGDSVVGLVITEYLFSQTELPEGEMAKIKGKAVGREIMAEITQHIGLDRFIYLGKSEETRKTKKKNLYANILEAVIGALYLEKGLAYTQDYIVSLWTPYLKKIFEGEYSDTKSELQEYLQKRGEELPEYRVVSETGPDHDKVFIMECLARGRVLGRGKGRNKKSAEMAAAEEALSLLRREEA